MASGGGRGRRDCRGPLGTTGDHWGPLGTAGVQRGPWGPLGSTGEIYHTVSIIAGINNGRRRSVPGHWDRSGPSSGHRSSARPLGTTPDHVGPLGSTINTTTTSVRAHGAARNTHDRRLRSTGDHWGSAGCRGPLGTAGDHWGPLGSSGVPGDHSGPFRSSHVRSVTAQYRLPRPPPLAIPAMTELHSSYASKPYNLNVRLRSS